jgi:predicted protein tyrosine phosphatase
MPIIVCPLSRAPALAREHRASHAVSLLDPGTPFPKLDAMSGERHLRVEVHDVEQEALETHPPSEAHLKRIIAFVRDWDRAQPMLIHCYAGISRSTATAFITACAHNPEADEHDIARALRSASRSASPNRRFVALADTLMARDGRMIAAIDGIGRGDRPWWEIGENKPFVLASRFGSAA